MRRLQQLLWPVAIAFGVAAEWVARPELLVLDAAAGFLLVGCGIVASSRRPASRLGTIAAAAGIAWFLGTLWSPAVFLVRGPLAHLLLTYPSGRAASRRDAVAVAAAYGYAAVYPVAGNDWATVAYAGGLAALATARYAAARGIERRARLVPLAASAAFALVLVLGVAARVVGADGGRGALIAYDLVVAATGLALSLDLLHGRWSEAAMTGLVVDLGAPSAGGQLRDRLAGVLGDPTLQVGYRLPGERGYVDETGRPVEVTRLGAGRVILPIEADGERTGVVVHDASVADDPALRRAVSSAMRLAFANARLQADVRARVDAVAASRRRILHASDEQRRRLERELREGPERRLGRVADLLGEAGATFAEPRAQLDAARAELREFARGMHPSTLATGGLRAALEEIAARSTVPVRVVAPAARLPAEVEAAAYFVCSEALANVAKYAHASQVRIDLVERDGRVRISVADDGVGGADNVRGSGLNGLADRVEALGGRLSVESPPGRGTKVTAEIPVTPDQG